VRKTAQTGKRISLIVFAVGLSALAALGMYLLIGSSPETSQVGVRAAVSPAQAPTAEKQEPQQERRRYGADNRVVPVVAASVPVVSNAKVEINRVDVTIYKASGWVRVQNPHIMRDMKISLSKVGPSVTFTSLKVFVDGQPCEVHLDPRTWKMGTMDSNQHQIELAVVCDPTQAERDRERQKGSTLAGGDRQFTLGEQCDLEVKLFYDNDTKSVSYKKRLVITGPTDRT
jgi:hypothetical protein